VAGGTTMHIDFALPIDHDLIKGFQAWKVWGDDHECADIYMHKSVYSSVRTKTPKAAETSWLSEIPSLHNLITPMICII
jgi:hypothetical protein